MVDVASVLNIVSKVIWVIVGLGTSALILWFVLYARKFNKKVLIYDSTAGGNLIRADKAREIYDDKNILCWRVRKEKITLPCPPKEAIGIEKGKKFAVLVRVQGDQYHWLNVNEFKLDAEKKVGKYFVIAEDAKRQLADQLKKAEQERSTKMSQMIQTLMPIAAIGILLIGAYFLYDSIGGHMTEMSEQFAAVAGQMEKAAQTNERALEKISSIVDSANGISPGRDIVVTPPRPVPN